MIIRNTNYEALVKALAETNKLFDNNVAFNKVHRESMGIVFNGKKIQTWRVTLKVVSSKMPGHRLGYYNRDTGVQRRLISACWHVHGTFIDGLNPEAIIITGKFRTFPGNEWRDWSVGSIMVPAMLSELCEC